MHLNVRMLFSPVSLNLGLYRGSMLWDSCINMSWPFKLSPHITNLNLNEPPLQIHQQAMTLHPPSPASAQPPTLLPPATHIHQQAIISRHPSKPPHPPTLHAHTHTRTPLCRNPTSCTVLIWLREEDREKEKWWGITLSRWLSKMAIIRYGAISSPLVCSLSYCSLHVSVCFLPATKIRL